MGIYKITIRSYEELVGHDSQQAAFNYIYNKIRGNDSLITVEEIPPDGLSLALKTIDNIPPTPTP